MTDKEIKDLASRYAEYNCPESSYNEDIVERNMDLRIAKDDAEPFIKWLSDRYCIVSREKIKAYMDSTEVGPLDSIDLVEIFSDLFPDLFTHRPEKQ